ncbi:hypothetical protein CAPTEDRAFT_208488 [Capitella teleta]|uniref:RWD domain-containing protein n=1 Tax=Capitella teleta TaxID=283909 RepID=R7V2G9_CAPTE|nr:hypothetical protein CAPTEDRAFT_208488 [Capitella teleta]|eukprot:ELU12714.1 hypothetical protein CAPTEDRAFT_208488 [Capitella teleta]
MASPEESQAIISKELAAVKVKFSQIEGAELISCVQVMVQIRIARTERKNIVACFQFPEGYPRTPILLELKSKHLSYKLLDGLTRVCEEEAKKMIGQQQRKIFSQILHIAKFIRKFIDDNPLCICSDEISNLKKLLKTGDEIKLKQKTSQVILKLREGQYYMNVKLTVPDNYPLEVRNYSARSTGDRKEVMGRAFEEALPGRQYTSHALHIISSLQPNFTSNTPGKAQSMPDNAQETLTKTQQMDPLWKKLMLLPYFAKADMEEKRQMYRKEQEREEEEVERQRQFELEKLRLTMSPSSSRP